MPAGCSLEFAADAGSFTPSISEVRTLLDQDRVRQALERADLLVQQFGGPQAELVYGWARWRNGDLRGAETYFRRAAEAGLGEGYVGLAVVGASSADWDAAVESAKTGLLAGEMVGIAHGVLAGAAWVAGDASEAAREMRAWGTAERGTSRGRAAEAMAAAVDRLQGRPQQWIGEASVIPVRPLVDGGWAIEAALSGTPVLLKLDFTFRQSLLSADVVSAAGLAVDGTRSAGRAATARWPGILSSRQAAVPSVDFGRLSVRNVVVAVAPAPAGVDGVIGADIMSGARWSLFPSRAEIIMGPPSSSAAIDALGSSRRGRTVAWLKARLVREGLGTQMLFFPRVSDEVVAAGLDLSANSRLDSESLEVRPGNSSAMAPLMLGGWSSEVSWRPTSLAGWAVDGGVAPVAVLGRNVLEAWALHWYPSTYQLRVEGPAVP